MSAGKSSLFRVIRKLWPLVSGTITMPDEKEIYFLTQVWHPGGTPRVLPLVPLTLGRSHLGPFPLRPFALRGRSC